MTIKQKLFISRYIISGNATEAARCAYDVKSRAVASVIAFENLRKPKIRVVLDRIMKQAGMSEDAIARSLKARINLGSLRGIKLALRLHGYKV